MHSYTDLKKLDRKSRNQLRNILWDGGENAVARLLQIRGRLGKQQSAALEGVLKSGATVKATRLSSPFPKDPPFNERLKGGRARTTDALLSDLNRDAQFNIERLNRVLANFSDIDRCVVAANPVEAVSKIHTLIELDGWSHALLRKIVLAREILPTSEEAFDDLLNSAGLQSNSVVVTSLIHAYSQEQSYLTIKRSILNIVDRGALNSYTRALCRIPVQPFALDMEDFNNYLDEVRSCSLVDAILLANFNRHLFDASQYEHLSKIFSLLGSTRNLDDVLMLYDATDEEGEDHFFAQCSAWLEYDAVRYYRVLVDHYYDASKDTSFEVHPLLQAMLGEWIGDANVPSLVDGARFTRHDIRHLTSLEQSGRITRSALFNYWLESSEGQIGFTREHLLKLMGLTRDLARTVPISATRTAARLSSDDLVRLILLLLLAKRSKNELDNFQLRKLLEKLAITSHEGSMVNLIESYAVDHPDVAEYIYDISTEDFLSKLNKLAPHLSDIPEIRASLHEWMARKTGNPHYLDRARAVRIDHQLNRVRNEIDDHRIYVDPSRFGSWVEDEMMIDLSGAFAAVGNSRKATGSTYDETVLSMVMQQCYLAFCSNAVFGIASYIGRRIRHGTFHGHLYSTIVNQLETTPKYSSLLSDPAFGSNWNVWKSVYEHAISGIIKERLHVQSRSKPEALLQPDNYSPFKQEILGAAVTTMCSNFEETGSTAGLVTVITDYCWRLAESDLANVTSFLKSQREPLKHTRHLDGLIASAKPEQKSLALLFRRDLVRSIDNKLAQMSGWFKRPSNVAPKASLSLLYDAVVGEVRDTYPSFNPRTEASPLGDIELIGGVYHVMYDSLAVAVTNAAKYGDGSKPVKRTFAIVATGKEKGEKRLLVEISSSIKPEDNPREVAQIIETRKIADFGDANLYQGKSGISKLMQLASIQDGFSVDFLGVEDDLVRARFSYALEH